MINDKFSNASVTAGRDGSPSRPRVAAKAVASARRSCLSAAAVTDALLSLGRGGCCRLVLAVWLLHGLPAGAQVFRVATFNVENYVEDPASRRPLKPAAARAGVCQSIVALQPDVIALQEMGATNALMELQGALKKCGAEFALLGPHHRVRHQHPPGPAQPVSHRSAPSFYQRNLPARRAAF